MRSWKRWAAGAAVSGALVLAAALAAQQPGVPANGKALAERIGVTGPSATKLAPQLDKLAAALGRESRTNANAVATRNELRSALADVLPTLTPAQRQQLGNVVAESRGGAGWGMGYAMGRGMGYGAMGYGMMGGRGYGMMRRAMGYGMMGSRGSGAGIYCPFYGSSTGNGAQAGPGAAPSGR